MKQLNKEFLFDFALTIVMWALATPLAIIAHNVPSNTIIEALSGLGSTLLFAVGAIMLGFNVIRRCTLMDK